MKLLQAECLSCLAGKYLKLYPKNQAEEKVMEYERRVLRILAEASESVSAPVVVRDINLVHEELFGYRIAYTEVKSHFNQLMLAQEQRLWNQIQQAADPLKLAISFSAICNYIDFAALERVEEDYLQKELDKAEDYPLDPQTLESLKDDLKQARSLVLLTDNCGEVVADKLLLQLLSVQYPQLTLTAIVRGAAVQNDADREDAEEVGLYRVADVLDNGNDIAGTWIPELSGEARQALDEADVILSKGQANIETLRGNGRNTYYIFLCKCHMLAERFCVPRLTPMFLHEEAV